MVGIPVRTIQNIEQDKTTRIDTLALAKIAEMKISVNWLVSGKGEIDGATSSDRRVVDYLWQAQEVLESDDQEAVEELTRAISAAHHKVNPNNLYDQVLDQLTIPCPNPNCEASIGRLSEPDKIKSKCPACGSEFDPGQLADLVRDLQAGIDEAKKRAQLPNKATRKTDAA